MLWQQKFRERSHEQAGGPKRRHHKKRRRKQKQKRKPAVDLVARKVAKRMRKKNLRGKVLGEKERLPVLTMQQWNKQQGKVKVLLQARPWPEQPMPKWLVILTQEQSKKTTEQNLHLWTKKHWDGTRRTFFHVSSAVNQAHCHTVCDLINICLHLRHLVVVGSVTCSCFVVGLKFQ